MKKIKDFEGDAAFDVVAEILPHASEIVRNQENREAMQKSPVDFISSTMKNNRENLKAIIAIKSEIPANEYSPNGSEIMHDSIELLQDGDLLELFGLRSRTASSGSASESIEAPNQ